MNQTDESGYSITLSGFPVIGIGASAGGLDAFKTLLSTIPRDVGMAFILVQHLMPDKKSLLQELLQKSCKLPVVGISDNLKIEVNHVYVLQPNSLATVSNGYLHVSPRVGDALHNKPADVLFNSLAFDYKSDAAAIVLSGTGEDGTHGLRAISEWGGLTIAQDGSAAFTGMPKYAIASKVVDFVLPADQIVAKLIEFYSSLRLNFQDTEPVSVSRDEEDTYLKIMALMRRRVGIDFSLYKQTTVRRRIVRRMLMLKEDDIFAYSDYLHQNTSEQEYLFYDLIIPVTSFFRDTSAYDTFYNQVIPEVLKQKKADEPVRIWVAGCSTGQEPYSIAMVLLEILGGEDLLQRIQIFASDVSERAVKKARSGQYLKKELEDMDPLRLVKYFDKKRDHYVIKKQIRDLCVFAVHNFLKDPPFAKMDIISCRNVLIYFKPFLQKKVLGTFHYALREKGVLWLGKSETSGPASELFQILDKKNKFYTRKSVSGRYIPMLGEKPESNDNLEDTMLRNKDNKTYDYQKSVDDILLTRYTPVSVIVNGDFDIVQFRGSTGKFLEPASGKASLNLMKMAKDGLSFELRNALHRAKDLRESFRKEGVLINDGEILVDIEVVPVLNTLDLYFLVIFWEQKQVINRKRLNSKSKKTAEEERILQLEQELAQLREDIRSITEDQEIANEELQSSNEELLSGSEELQSLNEELETSKEELQSANEELMTVNQELYESNEELVINRKLSESTIAILHEPLVFLDENLVIQNVNQAFCDFFKVKEQQAVGQSLLELQNGIWNISDLVEELDKLSSYEEKVVESEQVVSFEAIGARIIKFNIHKLTKGDGKSLIMLAIDDVTVQKQDMEAEKMLSEGLKKQIDEKNRLERQRNDFISMASHELKTPVTSIKGYTQALQKRFSKEGYEDAANSLDRMDKQINKLTKLIGDLLDATRVTEGQLRYTNESFDFNGLVEEVIGEMQQTSTSHHLRLDLADDVNLFGDRNRIGQVITNMLSNAIKYSPQAKEVLISVRSSPKSVTLCVQDYGIGISSESQKNVFEQFFRVEGQLQSTFSGLGLGLFIASQIIHRHGGEMSLHSEEGKGSKFCFTLPISQD